MACENLAKKVKIAIVLYCFPPISYSLKKLTEKVRKLRQKFGDYVLTIVAFSAFLCQYGKMSVCQNFNISTCQLVNLLTCQHINLLTYQHITFSICQLLNMSTSQYVNFSICQLVNLSALTSASWSLFYHPTTLKKVWMRCGVCVCERGR